MAMSFPLKFDPVAKAKAFDKAEPSDQEIAVSSEPKFRFVYPTPKGDQECHDYRLAEISGWPETKTTMETRCVDLGWPVGRICTDVPQIWNRTCIKFIYVRICHPTAEGVWADIEACIIGGALAGAIAAVISSPAASGPAFEVALKACLAAKGATWVDQVTVTADTGSECGEWH